MTVNDHSALTWSADRAEKPRDLRIMLIKILKQWTQTSYSIPDVRCSQRKGVKSHACVPLNQIDEWTIRICYLEHGG